MIVDTSAILCILLREDESQDFENLIASAPVARMSAANYLEAGIIIDCRGIPVNSRILDRWLDAADVAIEPVTAEQALIARQAYRDFGRGSGHPAQLNFGDCFAYALAQSQDDELLFKGGDFALTDVRPAASS